MSTPHPRSPEDERAARAQTAPPEEEESLGELANKTVADAQKLIRQELALAKAELREEATTAGKAAGMMSGAALAGYLVVVLVTLAAVFGLGALIGLGWAALVVAVVWAAIGAVLFFVGRKQMRTLTPPEHTIETLKEDAQWVRHPRR